MTHQSSGLCSALLVSWALALSTATAPEAAHPGLRQASGLISKRPLNMSTRISCCCHLIPPTSSLFPAASCFLSGVPLCCHSGLNTELSRIPPCLLFPHFSQLACFCHICFFLPLVMLWRQPSNLRPGPVPQPHWPPLIHPV